MNKPGRPPMSFFAANPVGFIIMAVLLVAVLGYYAWGAIDRLGLQPETAQAVVTGKQINPPYTTYRSNIVAGRNYVQSDTSSEMPVLTLKMSGHASGSGGEPTVAIVPRAQYEQTHVGDTVSLRYQRTRLSRQLEVIEVQPGG